MREPVNSRCSDLLCHEPVKMFIAFGIEVPPRRVVSRNFFGSKLLLPSVLDHCEITRKERAVLEEIVP